MATIKSTDDTYKQLIEENKIIIFDFFLINNFSLSTVESVTGGKLSNSIIKKAGASKFFKGSLVTYSIESKINILQIDKDLIYKFPG